MGTLPLRGIPEGGDGLVVAGAIGQRSEVGEFSLLRSQSRPSVDVTLRRPLPSGRASIALEDARGDALPRARLLLLPDPRTTDDTIEPRELIFGGARLSAASDSSGVARTADLAVGTYAVALLVQERARVGYDVLGELEVREDEPAKASFRQDASR